MKKIVTVAACLAVLFSLSACVPTTKDSISVGPDFTPNENVEYDFTQLHNDTLTLFESKPQYQFITDLTITGSNEDKMVYVKAVCVDDATTEVIEPFVAAVLRGINDSAYIQDITVKVSDSASFGSFFDKFGVQFDVYTETENQKADGVPVYSLTIQHGEAINLDPDMESYEEEWLRQMEILQRNEE